MSYTGFKHSEETKLTEAAMSVDTINRLFVVFIVSMGVFLASIIVVGVFGLYQWDYRCREGVTEERFELFKSVPVGGWAAIDGDPAGGCR